MLFKIIQYPFHEVSYPGESRRRVDNTLNVTVGYHTFQVVSVPSTSPSVGHQGPSGVPNARTTNKVTGTYVLRAHYWVIFLASLQRHDFNVGRQEHIRCRRTICNKPSVQADCLYTVQRTADTYSLARVSCVTILIRICKYCSCLWDPKINSKTNYRHFLYENDRSL